MTIHHDLIKHNMGNVFIMLDTLKKTTDTDKGLNAQQTIDSYELILNITKHLHTIVSQCPAAAKCPWVLLKK
jgi:hypothetical protein